MTDANIQCECTRSKRNLIDTETGELIPIPCNAYVCDVCGKKKLRRLFAGIQKYLQTWKHIRLWTFTLTTRHAGSSAQHFNQLRSSWKLFLKEIRRNSALSETQRNFQYIKVVERHSATNADGTEKKVVGVHFHVLVSEYLPYAVVQMLWERCVEKVLNTSERNLCRVNVRHSLNAKNGARYVCKYVTKSVQDFRARIKRWTKSGRVAIFNKRVPNARFVLYQSFIRHNPDLNLSSFSITTQEFAENALFEMEIHRETDQSVLEVFAE